jgi:hypothetical protein
MTIGNLSSTSNPEGQHSTSIGTSKQTIGPVATILNGFGPSATIFWDLGGSLSVQTQSWKYLLSKLVHEGFASLEESEVYALYLLHDRLSTVKDRGWVGKYFNWFSRSVKLFNYFTLYLNQRESPKVLFDEVAKNSFFSSGLFSACAYFGRRTFFNVMNVLRRKNLNLRKKSREPNRIGVGYRDHGTARNPALDGSPSWEEVATAHLSQESTNPAEREAYRTYLWKISSEPKVPYKFFSNPTF